MGQRLVIWSLSDFGKTSSDKPIIVDLDPASLAESYPELAKAIGKGKITSHSTVHWGQHAPIITFIVDD